MFISIIKIRFSRLSLSPMLQRFPEKVVDMVGQKSLLRRDGFTFKQFFVAHDRCAMKIGTDGVLLGAWAPVAGATRILDIGTGTGLLALMLAQRTPDDVLIDAVEIEPDAVSQARDNVSASPWAIRVTVHLADVNVWAQQQHKRYDLIVSNPPYFEKGAACRSSSREQARYTTTLDHRSLLRCAASLVTETGFFCVVLPEDIGSSFIDAAQREGWHCRLRTDIADAESKLPNRVLIGLSPVRGELFSDRLTIRGPDQRYSDAYIGLTRAFYLFM